MPNGNGESFTNTEPVLLSAVFLAVVEVLIAAVPDLREPLQLSLKSLALALAAWWARRGSTPNVRVLSTKKAA